MVGEGEVCQNFEAKEIPFTRKYIKPIRRQRKEACPKLHQCLLIWLVSLGFGSSFLCSELRCVGTV